MSALKTAALAVTLVGGLFTAVEAQAYDRWGHGYGHGYGQPRFQHYAPPVYLHPRVARKQAQLQERFVEKFGYQRPWGHGYHQPRPHWGHAYPRRHGYDHRFGW